jgi:hypothetical protein
MSKCAVNFELDLFQINSFMTLLEILSPLRKLINYEKL